MNTGRYILSQVMDQIHWQTLSRLCGDGISNLRITWYFAPRSVCGQYSTAEMIRAWEDPAFHE